MKLQTKAVIGINAFIVIACLCMGILGYRSAAEGFSKSLQMKAESNVNLIQEIMKDRYPGDWHVENGSLFKGQQKNCCAGRLRSSRKCLFSCFYCRVPSCRR